MHIFDLRRYSRNNNSAASSRRSNLVTAPIVPPVPTTSVTSTPRQPLVPQTNLNYSVSQASPNSSDNLPIPSSSHQSGQNPSSQKPSVGAHSSREAQESISMAKAPSTTYRQGHSNSVRDANPPKPEGLAHAMSPKSTYCQNSDLYTHNALNSFSFGAPNTLPSSSRPIDPLSQPREDLESDESLYKADTTPRPSVVGGQSSPRSHSSQPLRMPDRPPSFPLPRELASNWDPLHRARRNSNASIHTFGTSSASASVTSLSSAAVNSSAGSRSGHSATTPQTSANELTSDEENEHQHPIPFSSTHSSFHNSLANNYASDEELDDDSDFDHEEYEPDIDISSEIHEGSDRYFDHNNASRESFRSSYYTERRGSLAMAIPQTPSIRLEIHARDDVIAGLRRPSRSLEDIRIHGPPNVNIGSSRYFDDRPLPPAPTSVPGSEGDWRDLRRRSIQKENQATNIILPNSATSTVNGKSHTFNKPSSSLSSLPVRNTVLEGFDSSWNINFAAGIVDVELDQSEMADIVGNFQGPRTSERTFRRGSSSAESGRRLSTTSTNSDPFTRNLNKWGGQQYIDERMKWTFIREKADYLGDQRAAAERERNSISSLFNPRLSISAASSIIGSSAGFHDFGYAAKERDRTFGKEKERSKDQTIWKGMAIDAEEWWSSYSNGRYKVIRKSMASTESGKPPQQRLSITHHRTPYSHKRDLSDGPCVTIHKHSKAIGFSISRHYRIRPTNHNSNHSSRTSTSSRTTAVTAIPSDPNKKKSSTMILLAPRRVQEAFTSTTTTRKLESHGLLNGRQSPRDLERLERMERERRERKKREERENQREKEKKKSAQETLKDRTKSKAQQSVKVDGNMASSSESSSGSVTGGLSSVESKTLVDGFSSSRSGIAPPTMVASSARPSSEHPAMSPETSSSDRTISWNRHHSRLNDYLYDVDDSDEEPKPPSRTPHGETYATLPAEAFEHFALQQESHSHSIFPWKSKGSSTVTRHIEKSYNPPWAVAQARFHPDTRKGIVEDLNTSFQDVGLLPAVDEVKGSHSMPHRRKRQQNQQQNPHDAKSQRNSHVNETQNIFHSFSPDYLYMLLPLWPGETDLVSARKSTFRVPHIAIESRQYLLMYYRPTETSATEADKSKGQREKKRSRNSPTSSRDSVSKQHEKHILCDKFHISARIVVYSDIQGSGIRSPDVGLSVQGPLAEAYELIPKCRPTDDFQVIGICQSREKGVEFVPEGLEILGLTRRIPDLNIAKEEEEEKRLSVSGVEESDEVSESTVILTPIGRAVVEMAWLGSMALSSFGSTYNPS